MAQLVVAMDSASKPDRIVMEVRSVSKEQVSAAEKQLTSKVLEALAQSPEVPRMSNLRL